MSTVFVDSHCHLDFPELLERIDDRLNAMRQHRVAAALCPGVQLENIDALVALVQRYPMLYGAVAVHPGYSEVIEPTVDQLSRLAEQDKIIAIGETGLDYHYHHGDLAWQRERFRTHIRAARAVGKPLIVHCRKAADDVIQLLREEKAETVGGVMHCFSESYEVAEAAMALGFYISFSGVLTFKNAHALREVAARIPFERLLIETDSPYLAPMPHRGKMNEPAYVVYIAEQLAQLHHVPVEAIATCTTRNFCRLFDIDPLPWQEIKTIT